MPPNGPTVAAPKPDNAKSSVSRSPKYPPLLRVAIASARAPPASCRTSVMLPSHDTNAPVSYLSASSIEPVAVRLNRETKSMPLSKRERWPVRSWLKRSDASRAFTAALSIPVVRSRVVVIEYAPSDARSAVAVVSSANVASVARSSG
jgi:hypothetical protein